MDVTSDWSRRVACYGLLFHIVTLYEEATGTPTAITGFKCMLPETVEVHIHEIDCDSEVLGDVERSLRFVTGLSGLKANIKCSYGGGEPLYAETLSLETVRSFLKGYADTLVEWARGSRERFIVVAWTGDAVAGEGGEYSIHLPHVKAVVVAHTHPRGTTCIPSPSDVESMAGFLAEGGVAGIIVAENCTFIIRLRRPLGEDDYWNLVELSRRLRRVKDLVAALKAISTINSDRLEAVFTTLPRL